MVKKSMKKFFVGLAALSAVGISASADNLTISRNFFQPRAFSANLAREMLMEGSKHRDSDGWYGEFSATAAYQRSWTQGNEQGSGVEVVNGLGTYPFWSGTNSMSVSGSTYSLNNANAPFNLDAYQFGLGQVTAPGSITLNPLVYQAGADFLFVVASSANEPCFFAKIKAPVTVYNFNPNLTETAPAVAANYAIGELQTDATTSLPAINMTQAFAGNTGAGQSAAGNFLPMQYGLIAGDQSTGAKFGDIEMTAGYRFVSNDDNSFSVAVRAAAPTGGTATGVYLMEPIVGRGGNWGLGGYLDGHVKVWEGNNDNSFQIKFMANAMHLFNADTIRSFDLEPNGLGSKYLLVANYTNNQYQGQIANLVNYSTLAVNSSFGVEGDAVLSFAYVARGWTVDLGYEFWGRSAETLEITGSFANQAYAVLGNQGPGTTAGVASNACQPLAQMNLASQPQVATPVVAGTLATAQTSVADALTAANRVALTQLNLVAAQQDTSLTSKVFSKVTYEWIDSDYRPHLGVMGEFEISTSNNNALPQWSVALVGGVSF
jgi:hypothetical protein